MKKLLIFMTMLAMLNTVSCSEKNKDETPAPSVSESSTDNNKTTLTVATTIKLSPAVEKEISKKMSCDVDIKSYPYSEETDPFELLHLDMISGEIPDVVYATTDDMTKLINRGYMADMYPLMEKSETLRKEDFMPNVLAGLEKDGKLPAICDDWKIFTAVAKTENVGENMENWTPAQALKAFNNMPEDMSFLEHEWKEYDRENYLIYRVGIDAVDYKNNTCDFGGAFMEMLGNVNNLPEFQPYNEYEYAIINNHALISEVQLFGINCGITQSLYCYFGGEDITFVGYPSESGKGYVTDAFSMMGILSASKNQEKAYEFISLMLNDNSINKGMMYSMPITEKQLDEQLNATKYNALSVNCPQYLPYSDEEVQIPKELLDKTVDYIRNVEFEPYINNTVENIVREEYHKCFAGEATPQECADILNNRVSIYLSESE